MHRRARGVPHRTARHSDRPDQGGIPWRADGNEPARSVHWRPAQESRLRHRPVRQKSCRRSKRITADRERLRRVLRQSLSFERRGGAGTSGLSEGPGVPCQIRSAWRSQMQGQRPGRSHSRSALWQDRQADDRGHRCVDQETHGDDRRRNLGGGDRLHEAAANGGQAVLLLVQRYTHAFTYTCSIRSSGALHPRRQRIHRWHAGARRYGRFVAQSAG